MGCCASRTSDDSRPAVRAHSSSRNITAPSTRPSSIPSPRASHASQGNVPPPRSDNRPNTPLKPIPPAQRSRLPSTLASIATKTSSRAKPPTASTALAWTPSRLEKERGDWWDTQVTGSEQIWRAIRLVAQHLQAGELQEAQTMLDANDCTCPTGLLWRGVYDPTGVQYKVPEWVVVQPEGLAEEDGMDDKDVAGDAGSNAMQQNTPGDPVDDDSNGLVRVRLRTSHDQKDVLVVIRMRDTVATIIEKLKGQAKLDPTVIVRLVYGGRVYQDTDTLESHSYWDFANNFTLTALVFQSPTEHLNFVLEAHVLSFRDMGIEDPNINASGHVSSGGSETDPPFLQSTRLDSSSNCETPAAWCLTFWCSLISAYLGFQRWMYSSLE